MIVACNVVDRHIGTVILPKTSSIKPLNQNRAASAIGPAVFHRADWPFYWIARVDALYARKMQRALKKVDSDISTWRVLAILHEQGESSVSDIAIHAIAELSTTTKIVARMKADKLVTTAASKLDGRVTLVRITAQGEKKLLLVQDATHALFEQSFVGLTASKRKNLNEALKTIFANLNDVESGN